MRRRRGGAGASGRRWRWLAASALACSVDDGRSGRGRLGRASEQAGRREPPSQPGRPRRRARGGRGRSGARTHRESESYVGATRESQRRDRSAMSRVLHIEDDPRNRLLVRKLLAADGHEVIDAADGLEGVRLALTQRPDLVLVDLNIPGLDGYEVTLRLRSEPSLSGVPIVAITAEGDRDTSFAVGCDGFIQKPIDARSFAQLVRQLPVGAPRAATRRAPTPPASGCACRASASSRTSRRRSPSSRGANERLREIERLRTEFYRNISHELATPHDAHRRLPAHAARRGARLAQQAAGQGAARDGRLRAPPARDARQPHRRDRPRDGADALLPPRLRLPRHRAPRGWRRYADAFAERQLTLLEEMPRGPLPAYGDSDRLARAISQLLDNACKFTPQGGIVGVRVRVLEAHYELVVADSGAGRPARARRARLRAVLPGRRLADARARRRGRGPRHRAARRARPRRRRAARRAAPRSRGCTSPGAAFSLTVAKRAPTVVVDAAN